MWRVAWFLLSALLPKTSPRVLLYSPITTTTLTYRSPLTLVVVIFQMAPYPKSNLPPFIFSLPGTFCPIMESEGTMRQNTRDSPLGIFVTCGHIWPIGNRMPSLVWQSLGVKTHPSIKILPNPTTKQCINIVILGHSALKLQGSCNNSSLGEMMG